MSGLTERDVAKTSGWQYLIVLFLIVIIGFALLTIFSPAAVDATIGKVFALLPFPPSAEQGQPVPVVMSVESTATPFPTPTMEAIVVSEEQAPGGFVQVSAPHPSDVSMPIEDMALPIPVEESPGIVEQIVNPCADYIVSLGNNIPTDWSGQDAATFVLGCGNGPAVWIEADVAKLRGREVVFAYGNYSGFSPEALVCENLGRSYCSGNLSSSDFSIALHDQILPLENYESYRNGQNVTTAEERNIVVNGGEARQTRLGGQFPLVEAVLLEFSP